MMLSTYFTLVCCLSLTEAITLLPLYVIMVWTRTTLPLPFTVLIGFQPFLLDWYQVCINSVRQVGKCRPQVPQMLHLSLCMLSRIMNVGSFCISGLELHLPETGVIRIGTLPES